MILKPMILVVEDSPLQVSTLSGKLAEWCPKSEIKTLQTEFQFCEFIATPEFKRVKLAILDLMLPWHFPSPQMPEPPKNVVEGEDAGLYLGGWRCWQRIAPRKPCPATVIYTVVDKPPRLDDEPKVACIIKSADHEPLHEWIKTNTSLANR